MQPIDAYLMYCAMKAHFDKSDYDFVKYNGKSKVSRNSFYKRNDRIFFVKLTRKYKSKEDVQDYLLANFLIHPKGWVAIQKISWKIQVTSERIGNREKEQARQKESQKKRRKK